MPMPAVITFRAKPMDVYAEGDEVAYQQVKVPAIDRKHCDMNAFRAHPRFQGVANSVIFASVVKRALAGLGVPVGGWLRLDQVPECVSVDTSGFLARITIVIPD